MGDVRAEQLVCTRLEAARLARLSLSSLDQAIRRGTFPSIRVGKRILIPRAALLKILAGET
jgi:excisionase family DNA binding protein